MRPVVHSQQLGCLQWLDWWGSVLDFWDCGKWGVLKCWYWARAFFSLTTPKTTPKTALPKGNTLDLGTWTKSNEGSWGGGPSVSLYLWVWAGFVALIEKHLIWAVSNRLSHYFVCDIVTVYTGFHREYCDGGTLLCWWKEGKDGVRKCSFMMDNYRSDPILFATWLCS